MTKPTKSETPTAVVVSEPELREPTAAEVRTMRAAREAQAERPARVSLDWRMDGTSAVIQSFHTDQTGNQVLLNETFGTGSDAFANDNLIKLYELLSRCEGNSPTPEINAALALMGGIAPENEAQAAIGVQIIANHSASLRMVALAVSNANKGHVEAAASFTGMATKLSRTMAAHVEALTKLRGGGKQIVEHRYITVAGNAVVGDNNQAVFGATPGTGNQNVGRPFNQPSVAYAPVAPMLGSEQAREPVPVAGDEREEAVLPSRRP